MSSRSMDIPKILIWPFSSDGSASFFLPLAIGAWEWVGDAGNYVFSLEGSNLTVVSPYVYYSILVKIGSFLNVFHPPLRRGRQPKAFKQLSSFLRQFPLYQLQIKLNLSPTKCTLHHLKIPLSKPRICLP